MRVVRAGRAGRGRDGGGGPRGQNGPMDHHPVPGVRRDVLRTVVALVLAGVLIAVADTGGLLAADRALLGALAVERTAGLNAAAVALTVLGSTVAMAGLAVVVGIVLFARGRRAEGICLVATTATASAVFTGIKMLLDRPRPPAALQVVRETNESLPSGHATMSAAVVGTIVVLAWGHLAGPGRAPVAGFAVLWVAAVGASRIYLGVHWFSDVLAGWALGAGWASLGTTLLCWWAARRSRSGDDLDPVH